MPVMHRRTCLKGLWAALALPVSAASNPIQLHVDLEVDPAKEKELVANFRKVFRPTISKQPGFTSVRLLKLRQAVVGAAPANAPYRLVISFQSEEQRQTWAASEDHKRAWPPIESTLRGAKLVAVLYDTV
jgi:heme-degrading monooxygenase HmoA